MPNDIPITVSELRTWKNVGDNTVVISMTRGHARYLERALDEYMKVDNDAKRTREVCREFLARMDECFSES